MRVAVMPMCDSDDICKRQIASGKSQYRVINDSVDANIVTADINGCCIDQCMMRREPLIPTHYHLPSTLLTCMRVRSTCRLEYKQQIHLSMNSENTS